jgi:hypothetical protein
MDDERGISFYEHAPASITSIGSEQGEGIEEGKEK